LAGADVRVLRTDQQGAITIDTDGTALSVQTAAGLELALPDAGFSARTRLPIPSAGEALYTGAP
jgi:hypothetical protein